MSDTDQKRSDTPFGGTHNSHVIKAAQRIEEYLRPRTFNVVTFDCSVYSIVQDVLIKVWREVRNEALEALIFDVMTDDGRCLICDHYNEGRPALKINEHYPDCSVGKAKKLIQDY